MSTPDVYITANPTPNPNALKFIVDRQIVDGEPVSYESASEAKGSPLAEKLFVLDGVESMFAFQNFVTITKDGDRPWQDFAREIGSTIREHIQSGAELNFLPPKEAESDADSATVSTIKDVLDEIRPMVAQDGGNIVYAGYKAGVVSVFMQGSCSGCPSSTVTLKNGILNRLQELLPDVQDVVAI